MVKEGVDQRRKRPQLEKSVALTTTKSFLLQKTLLIYEAKPPFVFSKSSQSLFAAVWRGHLDNLLNFLIHLVDLIVFLRGFSEIDIKESMENLMCFHENYLFFGSAVPLEKITIKPKNNHVMESGWTELALKLHMLIGNAPFFHLRTSVSPSIQ